MGPAAEPRDDTFVVVRFCNTNGVIPALVAGTHRAAGVERATTRAAAATAPSKRPLSHRHFRVDIPPADQWVPRPSRGMTLLLW